MKRYKLLKDLPTFKAGDEFVLRNGHLCCIDPQSPEGVVVAYAAATLGKFPNILKEWFEEVSEKPKTVWDLGEGDKYFRYDAVCMSIILGCWTGTPYEHSLREIGDVFLTREDCEKEAARRKAKQVLLRDTKGFKPDYKEYMFGWGVSYDVMDKKPHLETDWAEWADGTIRFASEEDAQASIDKHEREWKIYLGVAKSGEEQRGRVNRRNGGIL